MPFILSLEAPGSPSCLGRRVSRVASHLASTRFPVSGQERSSAALPIHAPCYRTFSLAPNRTSDFRTRGDILCRHRETLQARSRCYSLWASAPESSGQGQGQASVPSSGAEGSWKEEGPRGKLSQERLHEPKHPSRFRPQLSRNSRKRKRQSRPAQVLESLSSSARILYSIAPAGKTDLSYNSSRRTDIDRVRKRALDNPSDDAASLPESASLYSILARYLKHQSGSQWVGLEFQHSQLELDLLKSKGYTSLSVQRWASCLSNPNSIVAAKTFESGVEMPPMFVLLLYLRRKHVRALALGIVMRHVDSRLRSHTISWADLKLLVIRLLRHARELWPESIPWVASLFATEATRLHNRNGSLCLSPQMLRDVTQFSNNLLLLLSLPTNEHPMLSATQQEKAQSQVLQYMASHSPPIIVTMSGFRSVTRNQLAHPKTAQEREWAELKGPSWPPWKENRTAMDEDKGYEFGASRASRILHRMYEAGYGSRTWEEMAEIYAGWDTDYSPTIQTRTSLPRFSSQYRDVKHLRSLLWAARIRTTRTKREAWACFLAYEMSGAPIHEEVYLAMFEKLYYRTIERSPHHVTQLSLEEEFEHLPIDLLPGDMKESLPDPSSPLHYVYLSEPVPTYKQLYYRMRTARLLPTSRLLAFLLETCPEFNMTLDILGTVQNDSHQGINLMVTGAHDEGSNVQELSGYLFTAFIRFLCRFGRLDRPIPDKPKGAMPEHHTHRFKTDRQYLLEYAHHLLTHYQPSYRPAWTAYVNKMVHSRGTELAGNVVRYKIVCGVLESMENAELDVDDELFRLTCTATFYAVQTVNQGSASLEDARDILANGSSRLRKLFNTLVGANADMRLSAQREEMHNTIPPHVPGPAELHAYVRALGILRDYEGLYSFSSWLTKYHVEVTTRAEARHSGSKLLFRTLVALRTAVDGGLETHPEQERGAPPEIAQLIKAQIASIEDWGGWPDQKDVDMYMKGHLKTAKLDQDR